MKKRISRAGSCLERSSIRLFFEKQCRIAATCDDVISFTIGEPDFITPPNICLIWTDFAEGDGHG